MTNVLGLIGIGMEASSLALMSSCNRGYLDILENPKVAKTIREKHESKLAKEKKVKANETSKPKKVDGKEAEKEMQQANDKIDKFTDAEYQAIDNASKRMNFSKFDLIKKYNTTKQWINYTVYFMTHVNSNVIGTDKETMTFVNAISSFAGYGPIYDDASTGDINMYDIDNPAYDKNSRFAIHLESLKNALKDTTFKLYMSNVKDMRSISTSKEIINIPDDVKKSDILVKPEYLDQPYAPFTFTKSFVPAFNPQGNGISDELFERLQKIFGPYVKGKDWYEYSACNGGLIKLCVQNGNNYYPYFIDNGKVFGGTTLRIKMLCFVNGTYDYIFVDPLKFPNSVAAYLLDPNYILSDQEMLAAVQDMFNDQYIYRIIDFSDTAWFDSLSQEDKIKLEAKLSFVIRDVYNICANVAGSYTLAPEQLGRFRFENFKSIDDFELVSDEKIISPLYELNLPCACYILRIVKYKIHGNNIIRDMNGEHVTINEK